MEKTKAEEAKMDKTKRSKVIYSICAVLMFIVIIGALIYALLMAGSSGTDINKILMNTGKKIEQNNQALVSSYNQTRALQDEEERENEIMTTSTYTSTETTFSSALYMLNYAVGYYTFFEYFNEFLNGDFIGDTYLVKQTMYPDETINARFVLSNDHLSLKLYNVFLNGSNECYDLSLYFDKNNQPTKYVHRASFVYNDGEGNVEDAYLKYDVIDFNDGSFLGVEVVFNDVTPVSSLANIDEDFLNNHVKNIEYYEFDFDDISTFFGFKIWCYDGDADYSTALQEVGVSLEEIKEQAASIDWLDRTNYEKNFDFDHLKTYEKGNSAMSYAFNKYLVEETDKNYLKTRKILGVEDGVIEVLEDVQAMQNGEFTLDSQWDEFDYTYEGQNIRKDFNTFDSEISQEVYEKVVDWFENEYDESKYYFEVINLGENLRMSIQNGELIIANVNVAEQNIDLYVFSSYYHFKDFEHYVISADGTNYYRYEKYLYVYTSGDIIDELTYNLRTFDMTFANFIENAMDDKYKPSEKTNKEAMYDKFLSSTSSYTYKYLVRQDGSQEDYYTGTNYDSVSHNTFTYSYPYELYVFYNITTPLGYCGFSL